MAATEGTYETVTKDDKKRRVAKGYTRAMCPECGFITSLWIEQYRDDNGRWHDGKLRGEKCTRCGWSFEYEDTP